MIGFDAAQARLAAAAAPLAAEEVPIAAAHRRILATDLFARADAPRRAVAAMDGYAVRDADVAAVPARLRCAGVTTPGEAPGAALAPGEARRVFTGAAIPPGADWVVMQEDVRVDGGALWIAQVGNANIRSAGSDFRAGTRLIAAGTALGPRALVAAAAADVAQVPVYRAPRVQIIATGDEITAPGTAHAAPGCIADSVSIAVLALAVEAGAVEAGAVEAGAIGAGGGIVRIADRLALLQAAADAALAAADVVVVTGGASVGTHDHARAMFGAAGLDLVIDTVAMRPGKPVWLGRARDRWIVGLPGNPTSALVTARLFLVPLLWALTGRRAADALDWVARPLAAAVGQVGARETFARAAADGSAVRLLAQQDSGTQAALANAGLLVRRPAGDPPRAAGTMVDTLLF